jgi:hypothetical protein
MTSIANSKYVTDGTKGPKVLDSPARAMNSEDHQKEKKEKFDILKNPQREIVRFVLEMKLLLASCTQSCSL